jgi:uncharacterized protein (TIGR02996 family)
MSDEAALLAVIRAQPEEDTPRLIYADWLDENDQPERAEFIRSQIERAGLDGDDPRWRELINREAELIVAAKQTWLRPYFLWADWSNLFIRRGLVELATTTSVALVPHLDSLGELGSLLELRLSDFAWSLTAVEDDLAPPPPPEPASQRGWLGRTWDKAFGRDRTARTGEPAAASCLSRVCRVNLAERPCGLRVRVALGTLPRTAGAGVFALELLAPGATALEPALREGEWTVLAWAPEVPDEARLVGQLRRALSERMRTAPPEHFQQRIAVRPVRAREEFAAWCALELPRKGPYWLRFRGGVAVEYCTGFNPPDDWLVGAAL